MSSYPLPSPHESAPQDMRFPAKPCFCYVCGATDFAHTPVLWPDLVTAWGLSSEEARYIDVQQGTHCCACGSNVRSIALAKAILRWRGFKGTLSEFAGDPNQENLRALEINEGGSLHPFLSRLPKHRLVSYPEFDMTRLALTSAFVDLVVHSDSLEHVAKPEEALKECHRLLHTGGALIFTVPVVIGRLTRSRRMLSASYHGAAGCTDPDMLVHTEFGADVWTMVLAAGFSSCTLVPYVFPSGVAIVGERE